MNFDEIDFDARLPDGSLRYRLLESGAVHDREINRIVARKITPEEGRAMVKKRWEKYREAGASAILKEAQAIDPSIKTEQEAFGLLIGKQYVAFMDAEKPRGDDLVKLGQVIGAMPTIADVRQEQEQQRTPQITLGLDELKTLAAWLGDRQIIEGETVE